MTSHFFSFREELEIATYEWPASQETQRLLVVHGMAEKGSRYQRFALEANKAGISVFAMDLPGHGKTSEKNGLRGSFGDGGWTEAVEVIEAYAAHIGQEGQKLSILGHSMGSMLALAVAEGNNTKVNAFILSAFPPHPGALVYAGKIMGSIMGGIFGTDQPSPFMNDLTFAKFNKGIENPRTDFDWLSRDEQEVDAYINDPDCGEIFTIGFFTELAKLTDWVHKHKRDVPAGTRIHYLAGSNDPVVEKESGAKKVIADFRALDLQFSSKIYPEGRHELLNDMCREEVTQDLIERLSEHTK